MEKRAKKKTTSLREKMEKPAKKTTSMREKTFKIWIPNEIKKKKILTHLNYVRVKSL